MPEYFVEERDVVTACMIYNKIVRSRREVSVVRVCLMVANWHIDRGLTRRRQQIVEIVNTDNILGGTCMNEITFCPSGATVHGEGTGIRLSMFSS